MRAHGWRHGAETATVVIVGMCTGDGVSSYGTQDGRKFDRKRAESNIRLHVNSKQPERIERRNDALEVFATSLLRTRNTSV